MHIPFSEDIILENDYALLRPLGMVDLENLLPVSTIDKTLIQYSPAEIHTEELLRNYIDTYLQDRREGMRYPFVVFDKIKKAYAGSTSYLNISLRHKRLEIGSTWIGKDFQRSPLNRNCKLLLLSYAFEIAGTERVEFLTDARNLQSQKAIAGIGATFEGTLRSHITMLDGYRRSSMCYSIIKPEWPEVKEHLTMKLEQYQ